MKRQMTHAWIGPYDGAWHCYQCGTTLQLREGEAPMEVECPVSPIELLHRYQENPIGVSRRNWMHLAQALADELENQNEN